MKIKSKNENPSKEKYINNELIKSIINFVQTSKNLYY